MGASSLSAEKRDLGPLIGAIDQGTSSTRFIIFAANTGELITHHQIEIKKIFPHEGWVEQDPMEIMATVEESIFQVVRKLRAINVDVEDIVGVGLCSQRESVLVWDRDTGTPLYNSIVWLDNRTSDLVESILDRIPGRDVNFFKSKTGLPLSTYFSSFKLNWLINNVPQVKTALDNNKLMFGTMDSWLLWNLIGKHLTDVTNASRTFLMNIETLQWDESLCSYFKIPTKILPQIKSSSEMYGNILKGPLKGVPIAGVIGDQHAALVGQNCMHFGQIKATYGTGCFLMQNIGSQSFLGSKDARNSLITTVAYKLGDEPACYAIEGSVAIAGAAVSWLRDNVELIRNYTEVESLARQVPHSGGVFFVPAFQGLYAPHWDPNATGIIIGLSQYTRKSHIIRATLEGIAYQTNDILSLMQLKNFMDIKVDGGLSSSDLLCQMLADISGSSIMRPTMVETTALGAAMVAGNALGVWDIKSYQKECSFSQLDANLMQTDLFDNNANDSIPINFMRQFTLSYKANPIDHDVFIPSINEELRQSKILAWQSAVDRSRKWIKIEKQEEKRVDYKRLSTVPFGMFIMMSLGSLVLSYHLNK